MERFVMSETIQDKNHKVYCVAGNVACMARQGINQLMLFGCYPIMKKQIYGLEREQKTEVNIGNCSKSASLIY